jgi:hypothetical protein
MGPPALLPIRKEGVLRMFLLPLESTALVGFEPVTFGSSGKHINNYTTKATFTLLHMKYIDFGGWCNISGR